MNKRLIIGAVVLLLIVVGVVFGFLIDYNIHLPERLDDQQTLVFGSNSLVPGSDAALRVVVRHASRNTPIEGATLKVSLKPQDGGRAEVLYEGKTNAQGTNDIAFHVPEDAPESAQLIVETRSSLGQDRLEQTVNTQRNYKILLITDKPLYQPGQVIHLRALALSTFDLRPAATQSIEFMIADGKGNRVFRDTAETSDFGVAAVDFTLATEVNTGPYKITATMGSTSSEKTVTVERYVLPKFDVKVTTDKDYYLPGEHVTGHLQADYFFGKPVADSQVKIEGFTFDVERQVAVNIDGQTDANGGFDFAFDLPTYIAGTDLEGGAGRFYMLATVTDQTNHNEEKSVSLPVAQNAIVVDAVPESGMLRPGVENIVYILCSYPDGTPAPSNLTVQVDGVQAAQLATGDYGLAEFRFTPQNSYAEFYITAQDAAGHYGEIRTYTEGEYFEETILLRPERATYQVGETMVLDILTTAQSGTAYLDIVREGQTVSTRAVDIADNQAKISVDLTPDLYGTIELHAYKILTSGTITRDTRLVVVDAPTDLRVAVSPDKPEYRPGDTANVAFNVAGSDGAGVPSALGVAVVDESVFALAEQDPGFAKLYFLLEAQLLTPRYDLHGFSIPDLVTQPSQDQTIRYTQDKVAQATLAGGATSGAGMQLDSRSIKMSEAYEKQADFFRGVSNAAMSFLFVLPLAALIASIVYVRREQTLKKSLIWAAVGIVVALVLTIAVFALLMLANSYWYWDMENLLLIIPGVALLALIATGIVALVRRDGMLGIACLAMLLYAGAVWLLIVAAEYANDSPPTFLVILAVIGLLFMPMAFATRAASFGQEKRIFAALVAALVAAPLVCLGGVLVVALAESGGMSSPGLAGGVMVEDEMMLKGEVAMPMPGMVDAQLAAAPTEMAAEEAPAAHGQSSGSGQAAEPPRLRQYFPETMYWNPEAVTDAQGNVTLEIPVADSITTWRLSALASSQDGRLGATTTGLRAFQDFFIDLDLPLALTQNDEVSVPVGVFNYMTEPQDVRLVLEPGDWFTLSGEAEQTITIGANDIQVVYFRIKATGFGPHPITVTAYGSRMSDAIRKEVTVYPDGKRIDFSMSDRLAQNVDQPIDIPQSAVPGTTKLVVKIYPGVMSQIVEGLDSILRMPYGCFEQTTSATYPNVLVLDYLKTTNQASPESQMKAEEYINLGYQRLTTFEVDGGGFSLFGDAPADRMLTAYGLQEFSDMSRVHDVDQAIISRAAEWLMGQQESDGSWKNDQGLVHESTWSSLQNDRLPTTAYIVWSLVVAGYGDDGGVKAGLDYVRQNYGQVDDPYVGALVANALVAGDPKGSATKQTLDTLAGMAQADGDARFWESKVATFMGSEGQTGSIETTALATYALLRADSHADVANGGLLYLVREKDSFGTWHSTQATILTLKAMLESVRVGGEDVNATVNVSLNGGQAHAIQVTPENFDVVQMVVFDDVQPGAGNSITIDMQGKGQLMYQVSGSYYLPWSEVAQAETGPELVGIDVTYDRTDLKVDDTVTVNVEVKMSEPGGRAEWALIDLGVPPGFSVVAEDLNALVAQYSQMPEDYPDPIVKRYELTGRQILIYIGNLSDGHPLRFSYRLLARFPIIAKAPASSIYDYYNPEVTGVQEPQVISVSGG
ncbi:MAG: hypothetical protein JXB07_13160 [Anaerolineae bacterium]|nr:hypothetical protein [Anaerolineae bacterium]